MMAPPLTVYSLATHGQVLVSRDEAAKVAKALEKVLDRDEIVVLSFTGVCAASISFIDELLGALHNTLAAREDRILIAYGLRRGIRDHVETIVKSRSMVLAILSRERIVVVGASRQAQHVLRAAEQLGLEFTPSQLAPRLGLSTNAINRQLVKLVGAGVLGKGRKTRGGELKLRRPPAADLLTRQLAAR